jgi:predicted phosphodiesterase
MTNLSRKKDDVTIGVISDTHGLLRPEVLDIFENVDRIIHAGDIGRESDGR